MPELELGKPLPGFTPPLPEAGEFLVYKAGQELRLFYPGPTREETRAARNGVASFALAWHEDLIWFLYRFHPGIPWSDAPFTLWLVPEEWRTPPQPLETPLARHLLQVILVDADTAVVKALRGVTLSPEMSWALRDMYSRQAQTKPIGQVEYQRRSASVQARYPTTEALLATAEARQ